MLSKAGGAEQGCNESFVVPDLVQRFCRSKRTSPQDRAIAESLFANAIWTRERLINEGLLVSPTCPLCKSAPDTLHHRLWWCEAAREQRQQAVTEETIAKARVKGPRDLVFNRAWLRYPKGWPQPTFEGGVLHERWDGHAFIPVEPGDYVAIQGMAYQDGSAYPHCIRMLARAGWGVVMLDEAGVPAARVYGPVWAPSPQTSAAGEWASYAAMTCLAEGPVTGHQDYKTIVDRLKKPLVCQLAASSPYAGFVRASLGHASKFVLDNIKVKAHVSDQEAEADAQLKQHKRGNDAADAAAKEGVRMHVQPSQQQRLSLKDAVADANAALSVAVAVLPLWSRVPRQEMAEAPRQLRCRRRSVPSRIKEEVAEHSWLFLHGLWRCKICTAFTRGRRESFDRKGCPGYSVQLRQVLTEPSQHHLVVASVAGSSLVFCARCGVWLSSTGMRGHQKERRGIFGACGRPTEWRKKVLRRLSSHKHPDPDKVANIDGFWQVSTAKLIHAEELARGDGAATGGP